MRDDLIAGAKWTLENAAGMTLENEEVRQLCDMADRIEELEAKLAKAVEAAVLQALHAAASEANYACGCKDAIYAINPAHLAELKGDPDA